MMKNYRRKDHEAIKFWDDAITASKRQMLSEMAIPLKMFIRDIEGLKFQIIQNWCLCKWCQMFNKENLNFNHWKEELASHMLQLQNSKLKGNIGKKKHLVRYFIEYYEYNDKDVVVGAIRDKFARENITNQHQIDVVAIEFTKDVNTLIDVIADSSKPIASYIDKTF
jgi:hypothetical protein